MGHETASQAEILDALPAYIALLDCQGVIVSVNEAWRGLVSPTVPHGPGHAVGRNYIEACESAQGDGASEARGAAQGIRSVLSGDTVNFTAEYCCPTPTEPRWYSLTVTPLAGDGGALVMYTNITEKQLAEDALRTSEREQRQLAQQLEKERSRLVAAQRVAKVGSWETDMSTLAVLWSDETHRIHETDPTAFDPTHLRFLEIVHPADRVAVNDALMESTHEREPCAIEHRLLMPGGRIKLVEERWQMFCDQDGMPIRAIGTCQDITERKQTEMALREGEIRIRRLNRVYSVLSQINALIVRAQDRDELFRDSCRIAVEEGGFHMAMIGIVDRSTKSVSVVASAGKDEALLADIMAILSSAENSPGTMVARAMREKVAVVSNDSQSDPQVVFAAKYNESGVRSMAVLPLITGEGAIGVLALYANETEFFHAEEMQLLTGLTGDIGFAIDHIEKGERLDYLVYYDALTGLANRSLFLERVGQYMRSAATSGHKLALLLIDLERFKNINDSLGRPAGDTLLRQVSEWLTHCMGDANLVARIGADHFALVLPEAKQDGDVARFLEKTMQAFRDEPFHLDGAVLRIAAKFGVALFPDDGSDADTLFKHAEAALKKAKETGDRYLFYTQKMTEMVAGKLTLETQLRHALDNEEFVLHFQPKVSLQTDKVTGAEVLIRWNNPRTGLVPPSQFIPILEEPGLINEVGRWALHKAIATYLRWRTAGLPAVRIAVNVSPMQLRNRAFLSEIRQALDIDARAADGLELEITESMIMEDVKHSVASLQEIRAMGLSVAIDDFGTGFSSLAYLSRLPVDTLKIDRSFVIDMTAGPDGLSLVSTMINLAHSLKLKVVAEGVETDEQARLLRLLRCDEMQGFLFSASVPCDVFEAMFLETH